MKNLSCLAALMASVALLAGCGGGDSTPVGFAAPPPGAPVIAPAPEAAPAPAPAPVAPPTVQLAAASAVAGLTVFYQVGTNDDTRKEFAVPGASPNSWDLNPDMTLEDGSHDQFDTALTLSITSLSGGMPRSGSFPSDQNYSELKYLTP